MHDGQWNGLDLIVAEVKESYVGEIQLVSEVSFFSGRVCIGLERESFGIQLRRGTAVCGGLGTISCRRTDRRLDRIEASKCQSHDAVVVQSQRSQPFQLVMLPMNADWTE